jgi:hypothetical protein
MLVEDTLVKVKPPARRDALYAAVQRYLASKIPPKPEWLEELACLERELQSVSENQQCN